MTDRSDGERTVLAGDLDLRTRDCMDVRMAEEIDIFVNRCPARIPSGTRLDLLLELLWVGAGLVSELVAVDHVHIPRDAWESFVLTPFVRVETIYA